MSLTPPPSAPFLYELRPADARKVLDNLRAARSASYRSTRRGATVGDVEVCVSCGSSRLIKWGRYRRWLRQRLEVSCVWVPRRRCTGCGKTTANSQARCGDGDGGRCGRRPGASAAHPAGTLPPPLDRRRPPGAAEPLAAPGPGRRPSVSRAAADHPARAAGQRSTASPGTRGGQWRRSVEALQEDGVQR